MTVTIDDTTRHTGPTGLTFDRTVDRTLLHRHSLTEVFLTDSQSLGERDYLAAALLPPSHAYYTDHHGRRGHVDPLLLLECARQAETYGGHAYFGVPFGTSFILRRWSMRIGRVDVLDGHVAPTELGMVVRTHTARRVDDALRALTYDVALFVDGADVGTVSIQVAYLTRSTYAAMRAARRGGEAPPTSADLVAAPLPRPSGPAVAPYRVGRTDPANVVLYEPLFGPDSVAAALRVPLDNASMFDHPQDHLPGMVMMESVRQAGLLVLHADHGSAPAAVTLVGLDSSFANYAELDDSTVVRIHRDPRAPEGAYTVRDDGQVTMSVTFEQRRETIARTTARFAVATPDGRGTR